MGKELVVSKRAERVPDIRQAVVDYMNRHLPGNKNPDNAFCYRHRPDRPECTQDAGGMEELRSQLAAFGDDDSGTIKAIWDSFGVAPSAHRKLIMRGLLMQCCFPQLSDVSSMIRDFIRIDFLAALPYELAFKILGYLDAKSLVKAAQVSKHWQRMADDDIVWYHLCEQHIDRKCTTCGWGLPLLDKRSLRKSKRAVIARLENLTGKNAKNDNENVPEDDISAALTIGVKRSLEDSDEPESKVAKRTRPWKEVYIERYKIENNWRTGRYSVKDFMHGSPVLCLQFDDQRLITGTYDGNITIWDVETSEKIRTLSGHFRAVSALKFDGTKLVTGSWDQSVRVWNYHTGECICTFGGHDSKVLCIDFDNNLIAAGSADSTIKVWDFHEKSCFTLRGHSEAVHSVRIHAGSATLYSSSEDLTVRMWDLRTKTCIKVFGGPENGPAAHVAQITQALPISLEHLEGEDDHHLPPQSPLPEDPESAEQEDEMSLRRPTHLLTASLDNTIKVWDIKTGRCARTLFGHVEGVWCMAADHFRIISGAHDKLVKVWDVQSGRCWHTFSGHTKPVCCVGLHDTGFASGGDDGMVKLHNFDI